jgi:hypothetical protein
MDEAIDKTIKKGLMFDTFKILEANLTPRSKVASIDKIE